MKRNLIDASQLELEDKVVSIKRVTKVVKGGRNFRFTALGVIAGGPARAVIELAGIKNIRTKCMGSRNKQNVVLATIEGLRQLKTPEEVARLRGKSVDEILA